MKMLNHENGATLMKNRVVLEENEIDVYYELCKEVAKLLKKNNTHTDNKLIKQISMLANQYIRINCFNLFFYQDAVNILLENPIEVIKGLITEKKADIEKALFMNYSVIEFTRIVDEIREKVKILVIDNWELYEELSMNN